MAPPHQLPDVKSQLNLEAWDVGLYFHPDRDFVNTLLHGIKYGVDIAYTGPKNSHIHENWPSVSKFQNEVEEQIIEDVRRHRVVGPFITPPSSTFVGNPMGAFRKKRSSKLRIIHDLSWPPGGSINSFIPKDEFTLQYIKFDEIVAAVRSCGQSCVMAKVDLESAFKHILVRKDQWDLLGFSFNSVDNFGIDKTLYYMSTCLPFGLRSSPKLFDLYATGLEYIMYKNGVSFVCHYLDDSFTVSIDKQTCTNNLSIMLQTCKDLGFTVQPRKIVAPSTCVEMLGIVIDSEKMELRV